MKDKTETKIFTDRPSPSSIYNDIIFILDELTGVKWGFVKGIRRTKYVTSQIIPLKIGMMWGKAYEKKLKYTLDISIINKWPSEFKRREDWKDVVRTELQLGLLKFVTDPTMRAKISQYVPTNDTAAILIHASEQNKKYPNTIHYKAYDAWLEKCLQ